MSHRLVLVAVSMFVGTVLLMAALVAVDGYRRTAAEAHDVGYCHGVIDGRVELLEQWTRDLHEKNGYLEAERDELRRIVDAGR
jgi:hypothetical protein